MKIILEIKNKQYIVNKINDIIKIDKINKEINDLIEIRNILFFEENNKLILVGKPYLKEIIIIAKVINHFKDKKIKILKFKRRNNYKIIKGHRQNFTNISILKIIKNN
ncbi:50S ribosomal protein L21 [Candidatus Nardonella dryophthoridicola]|uniref:Large ribosomal subunit protein bL21 n=1 Tax=endosymbiont of Rhynchophorus ferrugineus TaxID=1972133 RepID=A0A2Z5T3N0_9GAMM|nr:50S ribosomal protein L21 [Candidatus Nardonella dryophthoridicola]QTJ62949.1 50S ribosomal protein L21 [Candidatus Nardonella dryophthoridicola]BBA85000.1 50S ribosomal protein L21 [endosymbiont of Rhynchophorus ferrugineus]